MHLMNDATVLVTGGTGAWGRELTRQLLARCRPKQVRIYSRGEHAQVVMRRLFTDERVRFVVGDVRDRDTLRHATQGVDYVFHLAALKHIPICEENGWQAVLTNVMGTQNVIEAALECGVRLVVDASTDKAVDPFNLYGVTKACGEKLIVNANQNYASSGTRFVCVRGGNVVGTTGSVIPLFKRQIEDGNRITVTDPAMTRFLMSTSEAIGLLLQAVDRAVGGEIFVMKMPGTTLDGLAKAMIALLGDRETKVDLIGRRPGEKQHEALVSHHEAPFGRDLGDGYFVLLPQFESPACEKRYRRRPAIPLREFNSANTRRLSRRELEEMLRREAWLFDPRATAPLTV